MKLYCNECEIELGFSNINTNYTDITGKRLRVCKECGESVENKLKNKYFIEEYDGRPMYAKDGCYVPYWGCSYYFKTIEDCKSRMDNKTGASVNTRMLKSVLSGKLY